MSYYYHALAIANASNAKAHNRVDAIAAKMQENGNTTIAQMHKNELETAKAMSAVKVGAAGVLAGVGLVLYLGTTLKHLEQDFGLFKQSTEQSFKEIQSNQLKNEALFKAIQDALKELTGSVQDIQK